MATERVKRFGRLRATVALAALLVLGGSAVAIAGLGHNPANSKRLINKPIENFDYDTASRCKSSVPKGMREFQHWLGRNVRGETWGIYRCEKWGPGSASLHAESRAIDWHLDARNSKDKRAAKRLIGLLLEKDRKGNDAALARRMGVQGIIFNCRSWWSNAGGMGKYSYCYKPNGKRKKNLDPTAAHKDHVHLEMNWKGARERTSFWRGGKRGKALRGAAAAGAHEHADAASVEPVADR
ncbi:hypothetical protein HJD18_13305 [Thermoleophilia bacterium SCSIO 60948]|nr:hypothetical protein HJD18_13305 [Thermoleophilia bacterium SCSIO 60948]